MVMMSFKCVRILLQVAPEKASGKMDKLRKELGDVLKISLDGERIIIEGDELKDYRIHDRVYEIAGGE